MIRIRKYITVVNIVNSQRNIVMCCWLLQCTSMFGRADQIEIYMSTIQWWQNCSFTSCFFNTCSWVRVSTQRFSAILVFCFRLVFCIRKKNTGIDWIQGAWESRSLLFLHVCSFIFFRAYVHTLYCPDQLSKFRHLWEKIICQKLSMYFNDMICTKYEHVLVWIMAEVKGRI